MTVQQMTINDKVEADADISHAATCVLLTHESHMLYKLILCYNKVIMGWLPAVDIMT
jgi:hypothetical protein